MANEIVKEDLINYESRSTIASRIGTGVSKRLDIVVKNDRVHYEVLTYNNGSHCYCPLHKVTTLSEAIDRYNEIL